VRGAGVRRGINFHLVVVFQVVFHAAYREDLARVIDCYGAHQNHVGLLRNQGVQVLFANYSS
jgi:hypothetical protein